LDWKTGRGECTICSVDQRFTTLFNRSAQQSRAAKIFLRIVVFPFFLPLFILAGISICWTYFDKLRQRRKEGQFAEQMKAANRLMTWQEFEQATKDDLGTVIGETLSLKGPFRIWWTTEDIPASSPHKWNREKHLAWLEPEFLPFFEWCYENFTSPKSGRARLVVIPEEERKDLIKHLPAVPFVSSFSSLSLRSQEKLTSW